MGEELELWDLYDSNRNLLGKTHVRKDPLEMGIFHMVVIAFIRNSKGEYLLTKRVPEKVHGNLWEVTGGSALAGETSMEAMIREVREETGLVVTPDEAHLVLTHWGGNFFSDCYLFEKEFDLSEVTFQEGETCDAMKATEEEITKMEREGSFVPFSYLQEVFDNINALF